MDTSHGIVNGPGQLQEATNASESALNTSGTSISPFDCLFTDVYKITLSVVGAILAVPTIFGNSLIIVSIYKFPKIFEGSFFLLLRNLAMSEWLLGVALTLFPLEMAILPALHGKFLHHFCMARATLFMTAYAVSSTTMMLISFDRYKAVTTPFDHLIMSRRKSLFNRLVVGVWIVCFIAASAPIYIYYFNEPQDKFYCSNVLVVPPEYAAVPPLSIIFHFVFNLTMYSFVIRELRRRDWQGEYPKCVKTKTVSMIVVFIVFGICWCPFVVVLLVKVIRNDDNSGRLVCIAEYSALAGCMYTCLHWLVYGLANRKFRNAFKILLKCG